MKYRACATFVLLTSLLLTLTACGGTGTGSPVTSVQAAPLAGPNAAFLEKSPLRIFETLLGIGRAFANISSFSTFKACNDTMKFIDGSGNQLSVNGSSNPSIGSGLLVFDPNSTSPMSIGSVDIPDGTVLSEIDITFAVVPSICQGANFAVEFDDGHDGVKDVTQNTAFKFRFSGSGATIHTGQTVTLKFGTIVNGMVSLGAGLDDSSIQTVNVGSAE